MKKYIFFLSLIPLLTYADVMENIKNYLLAQSGEKELTSQIHCGFHYQLDIMEHFDELSPEFQALALAKNTMSVMQSYYISPAGHFKINYDTSGYNAVDTEDISGNGIPDFVDSAAAVFDHVWQVEIEEMGFQSPPNLGNDYYEIVINDQAAEGTYGQTYILDIGDPDSIHSYIAVDKSFTNDIFYTKGINALRVTAAHEFNHALQIGYNFHLSYDRFFMEMTSTWLEDYLYPNINDYYAYLPNFFHSINSISFNSASSVYPYANSIYLHYLTKIFSPHIVVEIWQQINTENAMPALETIISKNGTTWARTQNEYATWLYYTGERAINGYFFPDASQYPMIPFTNRDFYYSDEFFLDKEISELGFKFYQIKGLQNIRYLTNVTSNISSGFYTHLNSQNLPRQIKSFNQKQAVHFDGQDSIVVVLTNPDTSTNIYYTIKSDTIQPFLVGPNPVILDNSEGQMNFYNVPPWGKIFIFTINGKQVKMFESNIPGKSDISWDVCDENHQKLSSGIYFYMVKSEDYERIGKFAVIKKN
jgi:hypothetical protein